MKRIYVWTERTRRMRKGGLLRNMRMHIRNNSEFLYMDEYQARARALCESDIIPIFVEQRHFVYTRTKRRILLLVTWQLNHPVTKATAYAGPRNFVPRAWKWGVFNPFYTHRGSNEIVVSPLFRGPSRPGRRSAWEKRKWAVDSLSRSQRVRSFVPTPFSRKITSSLERRIAPYISCR